MYNPTKAKWNSHAVRWCTSHTTFGVSMERVFGVTIVIVVNKKMWEKVKKDATTKSTLYLIDAEDQLESMHVADSDDS